MGRLFDPGDVCGNERVELGIWNGKPFYMLIFLYNCGNKKHIKYS